MPEKLKITNDYYWSIETYRPTKTIWCKLKCKKKITFWLCYIVLNFNNLLFKDSIIENIDFSTIFDTEIQNIVKQGIIILEEQYNNWRKDEKL